MKMNEEVKEQLVNQVAKKEEMTMDEIWAAADKLKEELVQAGIDVEKSYKSFRLSGNENDDDIAYIIDDIGITYGDMRRTRNIRVGRLED